MLLGIEHQGYRLGVDIMGRKRTRTSSFGVVGREGHDSTLFYSRRLYRGIEPKESNVDDQMVNEVPEEYLDKILCGDAGIHLGECFQTLSI